MVQSSSQVLCTRVPLQERHARRGDAQDRIIIVKIRPVLQVRLNIEVRRDESVDQQILAVDRVTGIDQSVAKELRNRVRVYINGEVSRER